MIAFRVNDPRQIADALGAMIDVAGTAGRDYDFDLGPFDDNELARTLTVFVDGPDEVEASELVGQRFITEGIAFDAA